MATLFHEVLFPEAIAIASEGGPEWVTEVVRTSGGAEQRIQRYARALHRFRVAHVWRTRAEFATLLAFFHARRGRAYGFRVRDWCDYAAVVGEGIMGDDGIGTGYPTYQLVKRYDDAALPYLRPIQKPRSATVIGYRNSGVITQGSADGNISVDYTTGIITFVKDSQVGNVSITAGASTTVSVPSDQSWQIGQYVYLTGVGDADAAKEATPPEMQGLLDYLASTRFGDAYRADEGVIRFPESRGQLREPWLVVTERERDRPDVRFFLKHNPRHGLGEELACITEMSAENMRPLARRVFEKGLAA